MTTKVLVVVHSRSGSNIDMAEAVIEGCREVADVEPRLTRVPEFVSDDILAAHPRFGDVFAARIAPLPVVTADDLRTTNALILGGGTRFGAPSAEIRSFLESVAAPMWFSGELIDVVGAGFATASTPHGGMEMAVDEILRAMMHLGLVIVTPGYADPSCQEGGSPYGAVAQAGGVRRLPVGEADLAVARFLGRRVSEMAQRLHDPVSALDRQHQTA